MPEAARVKQNDPLISDLCIENFLESIRRFETAPAILAPDRKPLSYGRLCNHIEYVVSFLHELGIGRNDRIGIVLPDGPEMTTAFLSVIACTTFVPLNPAYREQEFDISFSEMKIKSVILEAGKDSPARLVAGKKNIPIIELIPHADDESGLFHLESHETVETHAEKSDFAKPDDIALLLQTSGTTSRAKIVPLTVSNIFSSAHYIVASLQLRHTDRCLNIMPMFHIAGLVSPVLASLIAGSSVICTSGFSRDRFFDWIYSFRPTWYSAVPTMHEEVIKIAEKGQFHPEQNPLRFIRSISFSISSSVSEKLESIFRVPVIQTYGLTEALPITSSPMPPGTRKQGSVGIPAGPDVAIMDKNGGILSYGELGEIAVRGPNVVKGYENNLQENERAFASGWFKTGDLGYMDEDGCLYIRGRLKEIINRGGQKVSPHEIEVILREHPAVVDAAAFGVPHRRLGEAVVAVVVAESSRSVTERELRNCLADQLAEYKVPQQIIFAESIPRGSSGKVNRHSLSEFFSHFLTPDFMAPQTETERMIARLWGDVLGLDTIGRNDNFFALGGDSLLATQVIARLGAMMGKRFPIKTIFENTTVGEFARAVSELGNDDETDDIPVHGSSRAVDKNMVPPDTHPDLLPLSSMQQRLWFLDQGELNRQAYTVPIAVRMKGKLNRGILTNAINEVIRRHDILRTRVTVHEGVPYQVVVPSLTLALPVMELDHLVESERDSEAMRLILKEVQQPFDLAQGPQIRAAVLRLGEDDHILLFTIHHIIFDHWSTGILFHELSVLYEAYADGKPSPLPALLIQYADYAQWQRQRLQGERLATQLSYWKSQLDGAPPMLKLPTDKPRPPVQTYQGARHTMTFSPDLLGEIRSLAQCEGVTVFMILLAAFTTLLCRYTGQEDMVIGTPIANRSSVALENLIGFFVNTLVLRTDLSGNPTFRELIVRARESLLGAHDHQDLPFEKLVEELQPARNLGHSPLFQVMFAFQNSPGRKMTLPGLSVNRMKVHNGTAKYDLVLFMAESPEGLSATAEYNTDLFEEATIKRMLGHLQVLLRGIIENPDKHLSELPLLTEEEKQRIVIEWNKTGRSYPRNRCIHELFEDQAGRAPESIAVVSQNQQLTYGELNKQANQLARYLIRRGMKPGDIVAICMERSPEMVVGLLGILKAGGSYVPLDPLYPKERLAFMLQDSQACILLTRGKLSDIPPDLKIQIIRADGDGETIAGEKSMNMLNMARAEDRAYVIYTSGSTGRPKGVAVPHRAVVRLVRDTDYVRLESTDRMAQISNISFDAASFEIWGAFLNGACLHIISKIEVLAPDDFGSQLQKQKISVLFMTTALFNLMARELPTAFRSLRYLLFGGETADPACVRKILEEGPPKRLLHVYGPTESTTFATWYQVKSVPEDALTIPIGRPISNTTVYLLDKNLQPVPTGVGGELFIGGEGLAQGYLNDAGTTGEKFIPDPFGKEEGARLYRTGDIARYDLDGNIEFLGRIDNQIKIRGFRVEPGEIEAVLGQHRAVKSSIVVGSNDQTEGKRLLAYVVPVEGSSITYHDLRTFLAKNLPDYMVPARFVFLKALPLTPNGKVDRRALPEIEDYRAEPKETFVAPGDTLEKHLTGAWEKVLGLQQVGIKDNFFALGGHSLLAVQLMAEIKKVTGQRIPVITLFQSPTIEQLAETIRKGDWSEQTSVPVQINPNASKLPLFWVHDTFLAGHLEPDQPLSVVRHSIPDEELASHSTIGEMAAHYLKEVRSVQPKGPYVLGGYCFWAVLALEMARQLIQQGEEISLLFLVEPSGKVLPADCRPADGFLKGMVISHSGKLAAMQLKDKMTYLLQKFPYIKNKGIEAIKLALCKTYLFFKKTLAHASKSILYLQILCLAAILSL